MKFGFHIPPVIPLVFHRRSKDRLRRRARRPLQTFYDPLISGCDLDLAIQRMGLDPRQDQLHLRRLKKRKLKLKDWITRLESKLIPDLDA
jgi:hypothetical protein